MYFLSVIRILIDFCTDNLHRVILLKNLNIYLDTDLKIILLNHQNNFAGILNIMSNAAKYFDILVTNFRFTYNCFDSSAKLFFRSS